jgi:catechol 2,3-dioxygenase-like lactoylglutathione lyase family enzyme
VASLLRLQSVTVYVKDQDRSLHFYLDQLGFKLIADALLPDGTRWIAVAPPDGHTHLTLISPAPDSDRHKLIGRDTEVVFLAEDVQAKISAWEKQGIVIHEVPLQQVWKGRLVTFEDLDGNSFALVGFDAATRRIEAERKAETERHEADLRAARELEIAKEVQARLFPQGKADRTRP